jgi:hypothetical protein
LYQAYLTHVVKFLPALLVTLSRIHRYQSPLAPQLADTEDGLVSLVQRATRQGFNFEQVAVIIGSRPYVPEK